MQRSPRPRKKHPRGSDTHRARERSAANRCAQPRGEVHVGATHVEARRPAGNHNYKHGMQHTRRRDSKEQAAARTSRTRVRGRADKHAPDPNIRAHRCPRHDTGRSDGHNTAPAKSQSPESRAQRQKDAAPPQQSGPAWRPQKAEAASSRCDRAPISRSFSSPQLPSLQEASQADQDRKGQRVPLREGSGADESSPEWRRSGRPLAAQSSLQAAPARSSRRCETTPPARTAPRPSPSASGLPVRPGGQKRRPKAQRDPQELKGGVLTRGLGRGGR